MTANPALALPRRRAFTQADGSIDFRGCMGAAREEVRDAKRFVSRHYAQIDRLTSNQIARVMARVREMVEHENAAWSALSPSVRAAATSFDALYPDPADDIGRADAVAALAEGRPAVWHATGRFSGGGFVSAINGYGASAAMHSTQTVFEAVVAHAIAFPGFLDAIAPLNPAGVLLVRLARAALAMRSARAA